MKQIWSLSEIPDSILQKAKDLRLPYELQSHAMFDVEYRDTAEQALELKAYLNEENVDALVITSKKAAWVLGEWMTHELITPQHLPAIYTVGDKTGDLLPDISFQTPDEANGESLAELILANEHSHVLHLCGDKTTESLWKSLEENGVQYDGMVVYKTHERQLGKQITQQIPPHLIWALSPSSVKAFHRQTGNVFRSVPHLVIGLTTHRAAENTGVKKIYIASDTSFEAMLNETAYLF